MGFFGFKDIPLPTLIKSQFTKMEINVQEQDAPFAFKKHDKSGFFLYNVEKTLFLFMILFLVKIFVNFMVTPKKE